MSDARDEITALVRRYIGHFNAGEFDAAFTCYRMPFTWFFGAQAVTVTSGEDFTRMMLRTKAGLVESGLKASVLINVTIRMLNDHAAIVGVEIARMRADDTELERVAGSYLVHNSGDGWRLAANVMHPVAAVIPERS